MPTTHPLTRSRVLVILLAVAIALTAVQAAPDRADAEEAPEVVEIHALSNRADLISGGDVLLEVRVPADADPADLVIDVDGRDVTEAFAVRPDGRFAGVVDGLVLGRNVVTATLPTGHGARLVVTDHPVGGPIFSGPQIQPWYCLEGAEDAQCNRPSEVTYQYKSAVTGEFGAYDPDSPPSDVATTTTDEGEEVPYVVRLETGNLNRSQYQIAMLSTPEEQWDRWSPPVGWNGKLYVTHGAGCGMGHSEGAAPGVIDDLTLSRGFAVMAHALEHNTENCNVVVQAESVMMTKEHLVETYGDIRYMMGVGCSGGSIAQLQMANAYPGLYDGLIVSCTYPDVPSLDLLDCPALLRYFTDPGQWGTGVVWTDPQIAAATTQQSFSVCISWLETFSPMFNPSVGVACDVPQREPEAVYHPTDNPTGVRCTFQDYLINLYGPREQERWGEVEQSIGQGFAGRPYDNVGFQYGIRGLLAGEITPAQFVDLNSKVGAVGIDYETLETRVEADPSALVTAYRSGVMNTGHHLDQVPIIDMPIPADRYEFHDNYKSWALRQRLIDANGHADNHLIWYGPSEEGLAYAQADQPLDMMDAWLSRIEADASDAPLADKVRANRPDGAGDRCDVPEQTICNLVFGSAGNIRYGAGHPTLANDVIKCELTPHVRNAYTPVQFTDAQWEALDAAFPDGVCDWTKPGVGHQPAVPWQTYASGPGGRPLGAAPVSVPFGPAGFDVVRLGGSDRLATAALISSAGTTAADVAVLASSISDVDAYTASPLAVHLGAPLLLTQGSRLSDSTAAELARLGVTSVVIVGGEAVLSPQVAADLEAAGVSVLRLAGADRVATAVAVADHMAPGGVSTAVVADGGSSPDGVVAAGLASTMGVPLLLVDGERVPEATAAALTGAGEVVTVGGVSPPATAALDDLVATVTEVAGADRYETSVAAAREALARGAAGLTVWVATGEDFADALVAGAAAGRDDGLVLLVDPDDLAGSPSVAAFLRELTGLSQIRIAGGPAAVSAAVEAELRALTDGG